MLFIKETQTLLCESSRGQSILACIKEFGHNIRIITNIDIIEILALPDAEPERIKGKQNSLAELFSTAWQKGTEDRRVIILLY